MKKLFALIVVIVGLCSCSDNQPTDGDRQFYKFTKVEYDGHSYVLFHNTAGYNKVDGVTHDPDCKCHNKE